MRNTLIMKVSDAFEKSKGSDLANEIWVYKHGNEEIDKEDREYVSWLNSTPCFLEAVIEAGLENLDVAFEVPTPLGDYIDVVLMGNSNNPGDNENGRLLIVELKQWSSISQTEDKDCVEIFISEGKVDKRRHPVSQICEYKSHMSKNHHGIYINGRVKIDTVAYLHNFSDKQSLLSGPYFAWEGYADKVYCKQDRNKLVEYLKDTFLKEENTDMPGILDDCGYIMDETGFKGLNNALKGEENAKMVKDQTPIVDYVKKHLRIQKDNPHKEIIVVSGGPGTGKTIIGMHFIFDYAEIFNNKENANGSVFCLPKSRTVKAMIDKECCAPVVPYMDRINRNQNLVVVDESHRITGLSNSLDNIFNKGTNLLILLQDDHQRIRAGEDGTLDGIRSYAKEKGIEITTLSLTIQKRCESLGKLLNGLDKMFYNQGFYDGNSIESVKCFENLSTMNFWIEQMAQTSRAKLIAPYCWTWKGGNDVKIVDNGQIFCKAWNPGHTSEQVSWYYGTNRADQVASIYTCQGLDFDYVAFIWWDDLVWDDENHRWKSDLNKSKDSEFIKGVKDAGLSDSQVDELIINTYYVMLSRARNKMGIWFKDEVTKEHVVSVLGLESFEGDDNCLDEKGTGDIITEKQRQEANHCGVIGNKYNKSYHKPECKYAPISPQKKIEFESVEMAEKAGYSPCPTCNPNHKKSIKFSQNF